MRIIFIFVFLIALIGESSAQVGKTFWFAAPDINVQGGFGKDDLIALTVTAINAAASVSISKPGNSSFSTINVNVSAGGTESIDLTSYLAQVENAGADSITNNGLYITSSANILAFYSHDDDSNPELYALKSDNALGTDFIIPCQDAASTGVATAFYVLATKDNTTITVTPKNALVGHAAGTPFNKTLNKGQVYVARANAMGASDHVGGTIVTADNPVAITMASDMTSLGGCSDTNGDQLVPTSLGGKQYIVQAGFFNHMGNGDYIYIYPTKDNTVITVNGTSAGTFNRGAYHAVSNSVGSGYTIIESDKNVLVYQMAGGQTCEVGGAIIPPASCSGSTEVSITKPSNQEQYLNVLIQSGGETGFTFNGSPLSGGFYDISEIPGWKAATIVVSSLLNIGETGLIANTVPFHLGLTAITPGGTRYGFFSNFNEFKPVLSVVEDQTNETAVMTTDLVAGTYQWYFSPSEDSTAQPISGATTGSYTATDAGYNYLECTYGSNCTVYSNTYYFEIIPTMSEWAFILFFLIILSLGTVLIIRNKSSLATTIGTSSAQVMTSVGYQNGLPFQRAIFEKALLISGLIAIALAIMSVMLTGTLNFKDTMGGIMTLPLFAYWLHLIIEKNKNKVIL